MPKERRARIFSTAHNSSPKFKRQFAVQDNAVEHVDIGTAADVPAPDLLRSISTVTEDDKKQLSKKEKLALKHETFLGKLGADAPSPYSRSHNRRLKRKAREQLANGMGEIHQALEALQGPEEVNHEEVDAQRVVKARVKKQTGRIGKGKDAPLTIAQRKRALELERLRHPLILKNPDFSANPFQTIRTHAQNTLVPHQVPM